MTRMVTMGPFPRSKWFAGRRFRIPRPAVVCDPRPRPLAAVVRRRRRIPGRHHRPCPTTLAETNTYSICYNSALKGSRPTTVWWIYQTQVSGSSDIRCNNVSNLIIGPSGARRPETRAGS